MGYNDIDEIAALLTDDVTSNNGLSKNISMHSTEQSSIDDESLRRFAKHSSSYPSQKRSAKSVTLLEMNGYRCVTAKQKDLHHYHAVEPQTVVPPKPAPVPRLNPIALSRGRVLEL